MPQKTHFSETANLFKKFFEFSENSFSSGYVAESSCFKTKANPLTGREKTKNAYQPIPRSHWATLTGLLFSAAVIAAPVFTSDNAADPSWPAGTVLDAENFTDVSPQLLFSFTDVSEDAADPDLKSLARRFQVSNFRRQSWTIPWDSDFSSRFDSFVHPWLARILSQVRHYDFDRPNRPLPGAIVPAPSAILLGTIGLLLVRALRERRIIE